MFELRNNRFILIMENVQEKAKLISDLYKQKSDILQNLSDLNNPQYYFVVGHGYKNLFSSHLNSYNNLEDGFITKVKEMTIEQYNRTLEKIESELNDLLKCN